MRKSLTVLLVAALLLFAGGACGGGGSGDQGGGGGGAGQATQEQSDARSLPAQGKDLADGEYATVEFKPALSFEVGEGWIAALPETHDAIALGRRDVPLAIGFHSVEQVFDPRKPEKKVAAPDDMASWLQEHPLLDTEEPGRVSVGGVSGQQFDAIASEPTDDPPYCPEPCVPLFALSGDSFWLGKSEKYRFIVLEDVKGQTVTILFGGPAVDFEGFVPEAQKILDTVKWEDA